MEREMYKFRSKARIVAFVDLILSSMILCICLISFMGLLRMTAMVEDDSVELQQFNKKYALPSDIEERIKTEMDVEGGSNSRKRQTFTLTKGFVNLMWLVLVLISMMSASLLLASARLLNATQLGKDPAGSIKLCRFWRRVSMFFTGFLIFNFFSTFHQQGSNNFFGVSFLLTCILIRIVALYTVQQFVIELDVALTRGSLPIHRHQPHPHLVQSTPLQMGGGANMAYAFDTPPPYPVSSPEYVPPPKYDDVVKEPYKFNEA